MIVGPESASQLEWQYCDFYSTMPSDQAFICKNGKDKHLSGRLKQNQTPYPRWWQAGWRRGGAERGDVKTCPLDSQPVTANPYRSSLVHKKIVFHTHTGVKHNGLIKWSPPVISINLFNSSCKRMGQ